ncbi:MAG: hypothetical protein AAGJ52_06860 [Pseudomonadota bacterium]
MKGSRYNLQGLAFRTLTVFLPLAFFLTGSQSVIAQDLVGAGQRNQDSESSTQGPAPVFLVKREQFGTTRVVELQTFQADEVDPYFFIADDQMLVSKVYLMNGTFVDQTFNTGGVEIITNSGFLQYFYLDSYTRQEHTFDPPLLLTPGTRVDFFGPGPSTGAYLQITLVGTVDPEVFADRFEDGANAANDSGED